MFKWKKPSENWTKTPNQYWDEMHNMSEAEMKVMGYIIRNTWGYQEFDEGKRISIDEFMNGRKTRKGRRIDNGTGLSKRAVQEGLKAAIEHGYIIKEMVGPPGQQECYYMMPVEDDEEEAVRDPVEVEEEVEEADKQLDLATKEPGGATK